MPLPPSPMRVEKFGARQFAALGAMMSVAIVGGVALALAFPTAAQEPARCAPADEARRVVASYGEVPVFAGQGRDGSLVVVYVNGDTGSWTALVFPAAAGGAVGCIAASGERGRFALPGREG